MADEKFELVSSYQPTGDQPQAIETLVEGVQRGDRCQTLLGASFISSVCPGSPTHRFT